MARKLRIQFPGAINRGNYRRDLFLSLGEIVRTEDWADDPGSRAGGRFCAEPAAHKAYEAYLTEIGQDEARWEQPGLKNLFKGWAICTADRARASAKEHSRLAPSPSLEREEAREMRELAWEQAVVDAMREDGRTEEQLRTKPFSKPWKLKLADRVQRKVGAMIVWLAARLRRGHENTLRSQLSQFRRAALQQNSARPHPLGSDPLRLAAPNFPDFRLRPFQVTKASATHQWTREDGPTPDAIQALAHNPVDEARCEDESKWTKRRKLVTQFRNGTRTAAVTVPGFGAAEFVVDIKAFSRFNDDGGARGTTCGYPGSVVRIGFAEERESMEINFPSERMYYQIRPRETNEAVITGIDQETYAEHQPRDHVVNNDDVGEPLL
jgi:hypothetical protein